MDRPDSIWVLHAMFERPDIPPISHHRLRTELDPNPPGRTPTADDIRAMFARNSGEVHLGELQDVVDAIRRVTRPDGGVLVATDDGIVDTGIPLGFVDAPADPRRQRVLWSEWARRHGRTLGTEVCPLGYMRFPEFFSVGVQPPPEGSLDGLIWQRVLDVLGRHTPAEVAQRCVAYFGAAAPSGRDDQCFFVGPLADATQLVHGTQGLTCSPSNLWPGDGSWFVYTDADLMATKISGSPELIAALVADDHLETLRWEPSIATYTRTHGIDVAAVHADDDRLRIDLPAPPSWSTAAAGDDTYAKVVYTGGEATLLTPTVTVTVSQLTGQDLDVARIVELGPGELRRMPGFVPAGPARSITVCGYPAHTLAGTQSIDGTDLAVRQTMVIVAAVDTVYAVWLYGYAHPDQTETLTNAADAVHRGLTIRLSW